MLDLSKDARQTIMFVVIVLIMVLYRAFPGAEITVELLMIVAPLSGLMGALLYQPGKSRSLSWLVDTLECMALFTLVGLAGAIATYIAAIFGNGFYDESLAAIDHSLGLDWKVYYHAVVSRPLIATILWSCYTSIFVYPVVLMSYLCYLERKADAYRFLMTMGLALLITCMAFAYFPARAADVHHFGELSPLVLADHLTYGQIIAELRDGTVGLIDLSHLHGLVSCPSFHTAIAIILMQASWSVRPLRFAGVLINVLMLAATPVYGGHYFVDMLAGAAVACVAIALLPLSASPRRAVRAPVFSVRPAMVPAGAAAN
jgi:hypothetical protein